MLYKPSYRADVDGLRAIAVAAVVWFHYNTIFRWTPPGGFAGVDVFFVISGYLITGQILGSGRSFSFVEFYTRRARRILPALLTCLIATLLAGAFLLMPGDYSSVAASGASATVGVSNVYF